MSQSLWDFAGVDALDIANAIFGGTVNRLAAFQSLETVLDGQACSVLRLCDRNFRIADAPTLPQHFHALPNALLNQPTQSFTWMRQFDWISRTVYSVDKLALLCEIATVRSPHRLDNLPNGCAVPAQIKSIPVLLWHHSPQGKPTIECHFASKDAQKLSQNLPTALSTTVTPNICSGKL